MTSINQNNQDIINIREYIDVLLKQKVLIIVFCLSAILCSLGITYLISEKYETATTIFYRPIERSLLKHQGTEAFGAPVPSAPFKVIIQTLRDAVKNEVVLRPVVVSLGLDQKLEKKYSTWYERWYYESKDYIKDKVKDLWTILKYGKLIEEDPTVAAIKKLRKNINIEAVKDSYIYILSVKDIYPKRAALILDAVGEKLVEFLKDEYHIPAKNRMEKLKTQILEKEDELKDLRDQREKILAENRLIAIPEETEKGLSNLYEMEIESTNLNVQIEKKRESIANLDEKLKKEANEYIRSEDLQKMKSDRLFEEVDLEGLLAGKEYLNTSIKDLKNKLSLLPTLQNQLDELNTKLGSTVRAHEHARDMYTEVLTEILTLQSETKVLNKAVVPAIPVQPIKIYHVGLSLLLSLTLSISIAYVFDFLNINTFFSDKSPNHTKGYENGNALQAFCDSDDIRSLAAMILNDLSMQFETKGGSLFLRKKDHLSLADSLDREGKPATIPFPLEKGSVFEYAMRKRQPIILEDLDSEAGAALSGREGYENKTMLVLPIQDESGEVIAIISLHNKQSSPFTHADKEKVLAAWHSLLAKYSERARCREHASSKNLRSWLKSFFLYLVVALCGAGLSGLGYYFLNKLGY